MAAALDHLNGDDVAFNVAAALVRAVVVAGPWTVLGPRVTGRAWRIRRKLLVAGINALMVSGSWAPRRWRSGTGRGSVGSTSL